MYVLISQYSYVFEKKQYQNSYELWIMTIQL